MTAIAPEVADLDAPTRRALADAWAKDGAAEHASVAAFSRFSLQCLALGAPAEILRAAAQATLDEVEHARVAFGLCSAYGGAAVEPGALRLEGALDAPTSALDVAVAVAREACIAETISALIVAAARDAATDPAVHAALARIADEEADHALLGWRYLHWALQTGGEPMRRALAAEFRAAQQWIGFGAVTHLDGDPDAMRRHGYLPIAERRAVAERALADVVWPAARALLAPRGARHSASEDPLRPNA